MPIGEHGPLRQAERWWHFPSRSLSRGKQKCFQLEGLASASVRVIDADGMMCVQNANLLGQGNDLLSLVIWIGCRIPTALLVHNAGTVFPACMSNCGKYSHSFVDGAGLVRSSRSWA